ncbi:hypothetical protein MGA447_0693 [Enterococcus faecalis]|nr:hypothetical protein [Enterococcus faecalis]EFK76181.1 hypothetical protein HMPREF0347_5868 [Enterococcus faecalis TUSoD Ef11]MCK8535947.1 sugar phosphate isomerase/epimerase [Enterococcus faecalis]OSH14849.1 hypothetical protein EFDM72_0200 [Enterococcus faecalis]OSH20166.1 hypothetical protein MGA447_0693 [Enterococcus faecalis]OSH27432.1 hypothetical protein QH294_1204 [Enterococcus faecalis]
MKNIFEDEKITISVLSCYINLIHPDLEEREKRLHQFETRFNVWGKNRCN